MLYYNYKISTYITFLSCFLLEFPQGMILPKKENGVNSTPVGAITKDLGKMMKQNVVSSEPKVGAQLDLGSLSQSHSFQCMASELYNVFTQQEVSKISSQLF